MQLEYFHRGYKGTRVSSLKQTLGIFSKSDYGLAWEHAGLRVWCRNWTEISKYDLTAFKFPPGKSAPGEISLITIPYHAKCKHGADRETKEPLSTGKMSENVTA